MWGKYDMILLAVMIGVPTGLLLVVLRILRTIEDLGVACL